MELATLITEAVKLSDDAHRANNAGHPISAKASLRILSDVLTRNANVIEPEPEPEPETPAENQIPPSTPDGDG